VSDLIEQWYGRQKVLRDWDRIRGFWAGEGRCLATMTLAAHRPRQDTSDDDRPRLHSDSLRKQADLPGINIPSVFGDYGTVSNARYWGGEVHFSEETGNPHIIPAANSVADALRLTPRPVDDPSMDAARLLRLYDSMNRDLQTDLLWMRMLDPSGPLNSAALILDQTELYMAMHDSPGEVHRFLGNIADFVMELWRHQLNSSGGRVCGSMWPYIVLPHDLGVVVTEDLMPLLSAEQYQEFGIPLLKRMSSEFGALAIHCCGQYAHQVANLKKSGARIRALEFHHPYTRIEDLEPLADSTVFIPYLAVGKQDRFKSAVEFYRHLLRETPTHFRYWFACVEEDEQTFAFVRELEEKGQI